MRAALVFQRPEIGEAALIAFAPGGDALVQPVGLGGDLAVQLVALQRLVLQECFTPGFELGKAAVQLVGAALVQPQRRAGQVFEKPPVMADQD